MAHLARIAAVVICMSIIGSTLAEAQPLPGSLVTRDWKGEPIKYECKASTTNVLALREALVRHERFKIGFDNKLATGWFYGTRLRNAQTGLEKKSPDSIISAVKEQLGKALIPTGALVYDVGVSGGRSTLCMWLLTADGLVAAHEARFVRNDRLQLGAFAQNARNSLGVTRIALARAPAPKDGRALPPASSTGDAPTAAASESEVLAAIGNSLLPGAIRRVILEKKLERLLVLPAADISTVPFHALPMEGGRSLVDVASVVFLTDANGLSNFLRDDEWRNRLDAVRSQRSRHAKLIVGDPDSASDEMTWLPLGAARIEAEEVDKLTRSLTGPVLVGEKARKDVIAPLLRSGELALIYFATHGISDAVNPLDSSFLLLSEGRLLARDIAALKGSYRRAPLVVMSACQSGLGKTFEGGTFGLARAWIAAGAPQVVTSLWDVGDESTKLLMLDFMGKMVRDGVRPEEALRLAMLKSRDERRTPTNGWAGFAMLGYASQ